MEKIKIIVADDVNIILERIVSIVSKIEGIELVGIATNGQEELNKIINLKPDLVITDNQMPILNGIDVIEKINNEYSEQYKTDFILVTADRNLMLRAVKLKVYSVPVLDISRYAISALSPVKLIQAWRESTALPAAFE